MINLRDRRRASIPPTRRVRAALAAGGAALVLTLSGCTSDTSGQAIRTTGGTHGRTSAVASSTAPGSAAPASPSSHPVAAGDGLPGATAAEQRALCRQFSLTFTASKHADWFRPSAAPVPGPLAATGFGVPAAQCENDPDLGLYYVVRIWTRPVSAAQLATFRAHLLSSAFTRNADYNGNLEFTAPAGIPDVDAGGLPEQLRSVTLTPAGLEGPTTTVMWI